MPALFIPYGTANSNYSQSFDALPNGSVTNTFTTIGTGPVDLSSSPTSQSTLDGWSFSNYAGSSGNSVLILGKGGENQGGAYSYGTLPGADRALGLLASGTSISRFGAIVQNNTSVTLTQFTLSYTGEHYRHGGGNSPAPVANTITFGYLLGATSINDTTAFNGN